MTQRFEIPAQSLSGALVEYSRVSGVVIVAPADLVAGRRAPAVRGDLTAEAALQRLLAGSGLEPRRRPQGGLTLVAAGAHIPAAARADDSVPDWDNAQVDEIVVTGERVEAIAAAYTEAIATTSSTGQYARWGLRLCPSVAGLEPAAAQTLIDHIARRAFEVGVAVEAEGCQPNLVIIFAPDSDRVAREIVDTRRNLLGFYRGAHVITAGRAALEHFANTPRPVRWWHVARTAAADGRQLDADQAGSDAPIGPGGVLAWNDRFQSSGDWSANGVEGPGAVRSLGTRMRRPTRQSISFALIIVDTERAAGLPPPAIADFLAMAALVRLDPDIEMSGFSTILNLFAERPAGEPAPVGMTVWDLSYLQGLYGARPEAASARQQRRDIARRMVEQVALE